jgi:hypothetical protein
MGLLVRDRTFSVHQSNSPIKMPTDLSGVQMLGYEWPDPGKKHERAVGRASDAIRREIEKKGAAERSLTRYLSWINWLSERILTADERIILRALYSPDP